MVAETRHKWQHFLQLATENDNSYNYPDMNETHIYLWNPFYEILIDKLVLG